jgi:hypothetical protein
MIEHGSFVFQIINDLIGNENYPEVLVEHYKHRAMSYYVEKNIMVRYNSSELVSDSACSFLLEVLRDNYVADQYGDLGEILLIIKWYVI